MSNEYRVVTQSTNPPIHQSTAQDRSIAFLIFGFLLACYLLTYTGVIQSSDGLSMFATTESMVRGGEIDSNQLLWMGLQQGTFGPDGNLYGRKGIGMALLALPLVWVALKWTALGLVQSALLLNPILIAWTGGLVYRSGRRLGWSQAVAVITALVFGLATLAWPYAQTFFSDPVAGWGLFAAFYGLLSFARTGRKRYLAMAGLTWGLAYLARSINLVTLPFYALAVLVILNQGSQAWKADWRGALRRLLWDEWRPWTTFALPVILAGGISLWWNFARYGNIFDSGYLEAESFSANLLVGVFGLLIGPARGLIWYSPVLLLAIPGAVRLWRTHRWATGLILAVSGVYVLLYGKWFMWHGGYSWGAPFPGAADALFGPAHRPSLGRVDRGGLGRAKGSLGRRGVDGPVRRGPMAWHDHPLRPCPRLAGRHRTAPLCAPDLHPAGLFASDFAMAFLGAGERGRQPDLCLVAGGSGRGVD